MPIVMKNHWPEEYGDMPTLHDRVARGIALLEECEPGCTKDIDLSSLNQQSCRWCLAGQVLGDFVNIRNQLGLVFKSDHSDEFHLIDFMYGFETFGDESYLHLNQEVVDQLSCP